MILLTALAFGAEERQHTASLTVKVAQIEAAQSSVRAKAEALGGWMQRLSDDAIDLQVPTDQLGALTEHIEAEGLVVDREERVDDLAEQLVEARERVASRQKLLDDYTALMATADTKTVVSLERAIAEVLVQLEALQGRVRFLEHRAAHANVSVWFNFRDRAAPVRTGHSSFSWLNLDLDGFVDRMGRSRRKGTRKAMRLEGVDGFVVYRDKKEYRAVSADGVRLATHAVKHKPKADLAFWKEALRNRMTDAGYTVVSEQDGDGVYAIELGAPLGETDWRYLVSVRPEGGTLHILEAAGADEAFSAHRDALLGLAR